MERNNPDFYGRVMHGYIVHERSRSGYSALLLGGKALILLTALCGLSLLAFASPAIGSHSMYGAIITGAALAVLIGLGWVEARSGKPVLRPRGIPGSGFWHWEFEMPKPASGNAETAG
ncbi:hypothetical protein KNJ79_00815 [Sphingopyxis indica]|uniref:hypothetical protein n=1 Tax=Sphingopyxis indica TaxID=436663 RepID=UPI002938E2D0|nr:hypothetical protein [Sphingopyxis indica]WOF43544.1 hypothetical protein KNJ79_00815 [Sphingopyxis indica]